MADNILTPQYLDMDYTTMKARLKTLLEANPTFRDYNLEGANISVLMELVCYLGMLTTYYANQIAKNQYMETADLYETVHMLSRLRGYNPQGYISSETDLTITLTLTPSGSTGTVGSVDPGDILLIEAWKQIECSDVEDDDGNIMKFATIEDTIINVPVASPYVSTYTFTVPIRQGIVYNVSYTGEDIIDNIISLPTYNFDYDNDLEDQSPSIELSVNGTVWTRVSDFYDLLSGLENEQNIYMLRYNKYQKYIIEFSSSRNVPIPTDTINITLLRSAGIDSNLAIGKIILPETNFILNQTGVRAGYINNDENVSVTNLTSATGGADPETIVDIKTSSTGTIHSQFRNVTKYDYIQHLEAKSDIEVANVWGEQEVAPSGSILEYNKVYVSVIPVEWGTSTISISASGDIFVPVAYSNTFKVNLATYLEPRKMIAAYEEYTLPEIIWFGFDFGIKIKRTYTFSLVANDVRNKLSYYFEAANRRFNEIISFTDIIEYILDPTIVSTTDTFSNIKGIQTLLVRDINVLNGITVYAYGSSSYPNYVQDSYSGDNVLRYIQLGHNQFPAVSLADSSFILET
jgi:hypothetical protein